MPAKGTTWPKFVQIAVTAAGGLFALDNRGRVWIFNDQVGAWQRVTSRHTPGIAGVEETNGPDQETEAWTKPR